MTETTKSRNRVWPSSTECNFYYDDIDGLNEGDFVCHIVFDCPNFYFMPSLHYDQMWCELGTPEDIGSPAYWQSKCFQVEQLYAVKPDANYKGRHDIYAWWAKDHWHATITEICIPRDSEKWFVLRPENGILKRPWIKEYR